MPRIETYATKSSLADADYIPLADSADLDVNSRPKTKKMPGSVINDQLDTLTTGVSTNASNISTNAGNISTNTTNIATNTADIASLGGGVISTKTTSYTFLDDDDITFLYCDFSADGNANLPTIADNTGRRLRVINISTGGYIADVVGEGSEKINSQSNVPLVSKYDWLQVVEKGGVWVVEAFNINYSTGWINRSDWTNVHLGSDTTKNTDSDIDHNFGCPISSIICRAFHSTDGTDGNSNEMAIAANYIGGYYGLTVYDIDNNSLRVQSGTVGFFYNSDAGGGGSLLVSNDEYYKVICSRRNIL
jgi:hypothetical protein